MDGVIEAQKSNTYIRLIEKQDFARGLDDSVKYKSRLCSEYSRIEKGHLEERSSLSIHHSSKWN